jgi:hypothetical protein
MSNQERLTANSAWLRISPRRRTGLPNGITKWCSRCSDATKPEIKDAVESLFNVKVKGVTVLNVKGKNKRFGRRFGRAFGLEESLRLPGSRP